MATVDDRNFSGGVYYELFLIEGDITHRKKLDLSAGVFYHWQTVGCAAESLYAIEKGDPKVLAIAGEFWEAEIDEKTKGVYYEC